MTTIYDTLRLYRDLTKYSGVVGLEIETETLKAYNIPRLSFWEGKSDGSLRNFGVEYVLRQPLAFEGEVDKALEEFKSKLGNTEFIKDSITTSVHVHLNMLHETWTTFANFLTAYSLFENLLIRFSGPDRLSNLFCLPMCDAEGVNRRMVEVLRSIEASPTANLRIEENRSKYSALNIATLTRFGSVEVRSFRGTTDIELIKDWTTLLYNLLQFSKQKITPLDILEAYRNTGVELLNDVFGDKSSLIRYDDRQKLIDRNLWYAANVAGSVKDWSTFGSPPKTKMKKNQFIERLEHFSYKEFGLNFNQLTDAQMLVVSEQIYRYLTVNNQEPPVDFANNLNGVQELRRAYGEAAAPARNRAERRAAVAEVGPINIAAALDNIPNFNDVEPEEGEDF